MGDADQNAAVLVPVFGERKENAAIAELNSQEIRAFRAVARNSYLSLGRRDLVDSAKDDQTDIRR